MVALHAGAAISEFRFSSNQTTNHAAISAATNFDSALDGMPTNCIISLGTGVYETLGRMGWSPKVNQTIKGAGMGKTIIRFPASAVSAGLVSNNPIIGIQPAFYLTASNITLEDVTLDCNYQPGALVTLSGANLGPNAHFKNVELINCASFTKSDAAYDESFGLTASSFPFDSCVGGTFENCWVHGYKGNFHNNLSAINYFGNCSRARITNCRIDGSGTNGIVFGVNSGSSDSTIDNCWFTGIQICIHADTSIGATNLIVSDCHAIGVNQFVDFQNATYKNFHSHGNMISLFNVPGDPTATMAAYYFHPSGSYFNIDISGDAVHGPTTAWYVVGDNMRGLTIHDDTFEDALKNRVNSQNSTGYSFYDNWLFGNVWSF